MAEDVLDHVCLLQDDVRWSCPIDKDEVTLFRFVAISHISLASGGASTGCKFCENGLFFDFLDVFGSVPLEQVLLNCFLHACQEQKLRSCLPRGHEVVLRL